MNLKNILTLETDSVLMAENGNLGIKTHSSEKLSHTLQILNYKHSKSFMGEKDNGKEEGEEEEEKKEKEKKKKKKLRKE